MSFWTWVVVYVLGIAAVMGGLYLNRGVVPHEGDGHH